MRRHAGPASSAKATDENATMANRPAATKPGNGALSIFNGEPLPDLVEALLQRVEALMHGAVVQIEQIAGGEEAEDPVVALDIEQHGLDRMANESKDAPHNVHIHTPASRSGRNYHDRTSRV